MTDVTQAGSLGILCSIAEMFWLVWRMERAYAARAVDRTGNLTRDLTWREGFAGLWRERRWRLPLLTPLYGVLWYGMRDVLSWMPVLLVLTILGWLVWECGLWESVMTVSGYLLCLVILLWGCGRLASHGLLTEQLLWLGGNLSVCGVQWLSRKRVPKEKSAGGILPGESLRGCGRETGQLLGQFGMAFFLTLFVSNFLWDMFRGERVRDYFFLACLVTVLSIASFAAQRERMQEELERLDLQNGLLEQSYQRTRDFYDENAKLYHDMHHHLRAVEQLIAGGETAEALEYIASVQEPVHRTTIPVRTGVELVDTILYELTKRAEQRDVAVQIEAGMFAGQEGIEKKDLCALFANLTGNALEAAAGWIRLATRTTPGLLLLEIENDCSEEPELVGGRFRSQKPDGARHGWGLRIVEQIVQKYEGQMDCEIRREEGIPSVRIRVWLNL